MDHNQKTKAEQLLELHHSGKLLILPNIWDVLGARLLEKSGYHAIATASAAVAFANGYNDGQQIPFSKLLNLLTDICSNTELPVSADIERGYATNLPELSDNIKKLIKAGVVGINIEDSTEEGTLLTIEQQCERIQLIRKTAKQQGVPMVINARCDVFLRQSVDEHNRLSTAINRGKQYKEAGADCFYPILCNPNDLAEINTQVDLPINVLATRDLMPMDELENMGIARLSLGPYLLKAALTKMQEVVTALKNYEGYESFTNQDMITSSAIVNMIESGR